MGVASTGGAGGVYYMQGGGGGGGGGASTGWNGPREEVSQCGSAVSKEIRVP